jgi:hypothetical protein
MAMTDAVYRELYKRHRARLQKQTIKEELIVTLYRLQVLDRKSFRDAMDEWCSEYDTLNLSWNLMREEYNNSK